MESITPGAYTPCLKNLLFVNFFADGKTAKHLNKRHGRKADDVNWTRGTNRDCHPCSFTENVASVEHTLINPTLIRYRRCIKLSSGFDTKSARANIHVISPIR